MGVLIETSTVDDLDGTFPARKIKFGLDGIDYEIDLAEKNEEVLRNIFADFIPSARKVRRRATTTAKKATQKKTKK